MAEIRRLLDIMARLRDPQTGCPWDLEQDFASISPFTIEEAYEVDEAIASGDAEAIRDELGDLLFQVVFQARIAEEKGLFDWSGVVEAISDKLVRRHPHVFAEADAPGDSKAQLESWEAIKAAERTAAAAAGAVPDPFDGIPRQLPALARAAKIAGRLEQVDPRTRVALPEADRDPSARTQRACIEGALRALGDAGGSEEPVATPREAAAEAIGAGLQAWARLARACGVDPEQALRAADDRTMRRVRRD